jgi:hypothetical protein
VIVEAAHRAGVPVIAYKPIERLAYKAAEVAVKLARRQPHGEATRGIGNGKIDVPSILLPPVAVDKDTSSRPSSPTAIRSSRTSTTMSRASAGQRSRSREPGGGSLASRSGRGQEESPTRLSKSSNLASFRKLSYFGLTPMYGIQTEPSATPFSSQVMAFCLSPRPA